MQEQKQKILVILGPTASGKSDLAVTLAKKFNGEIISADSRQIYRGMDIGTGKITKKEMRGIPHYLLDVAFPKRVFTASDYGRLAKLAIKKTLAKGKLPIICGGTGFYIVSALEERTLAEVPPNPALRKKLEKKSVGELFAELQKLDPGRAASIDSKNPRRLVRAIEVALSLGKAPARNRKEEFVALKLGVSWSKEQLRRRIHARLISRLDHGMIQEVKQLHGRGISWGRLDGFGLEYRYLSRYLRGILGKEKMIEELDRESFRYAKRQLTWFGRDKSIRWVKNEKQAERITRGFLKNRTP